MDGGDVMENGKSSFNGRLEGPPEGPLALEGLFEDTCSLRGDLTY